MKTQSATADLPPEASSPEFERAAEAAQAALLRAAAAVASANAMLDAHTKMNADREAKEVERQKRLEAAFAQGRREEQLQIELKRMDRESAARSAEFARVNRRTKRTLGRLRKRAAPRGTARSRAASGRRPVRVRGSRRCASRSSSRGGDSGDDGESAPGVGRPPLPHLSLAGGRR